MRDGDELSTEEFEAYVGLVHGAWRPSPLRFVPKWTAELSRLMRGAVRGVIESRSSSIPGAGLGVFATRDIPKGTTWPYIGIIYPDDANYPHKTCTYCISAFQHDSIDGHPFRTLRKWNLIPRINEALSRRKTRWCRTMDRIRKANVIFVDAEGEWRGVTTIMAETKRDIAAGEELFAYYGNVYEREYDPDT